MPERDPSRHEIRRDEGGEQHQMDRARTVVECARPRKVYIETARSEPTGSSRSVRAPAPAAPIHQRRQEPTAGKVGPIVKRARPNARLTFALELIGARRLDRH